MVYVFVYIREYFGHVMSTCHTHGPPEKPLVIVHNFKHISEIALGVKLFNEKKTTTKKKKH